MRVGWIILCAMLLLAGCQDPAVVFAPTSLPPDRSPQTYTHPGGVFSLSIPPDWAVYTQHTTQLASAAFTPPGEIVPYLRVVVVNLNVEPILNDVVQVYQQELRSDLARYTEQDRQLMEDGSWRLTGLRESIGGELEQVNTFIAADGTLLSVVDVVIPDSPELLTQLEHGVNTLQVNANASLEAANLLALSAISNTSLEVMNISTWWTPQGVYFVTGEVANRGTGYVTDVPVRVELQTEQGEGIAEALDTVMGYGIRPGEFAPFSLRFGQGQPENAPNYVLTLGNAEWNPVAEQTQLYGSEVLTWTDESSVTQDGHLLISGSVTNTGQNTVYDPLATVTVFDANQQVIAAAFTSVLEGALRPGASEEFSIRVPEYGGEAVNYYVNIQALPDES